MAFSSDKYIDPLKKLAGELAAISATNQTLSATELDALRSVFDELDKARRLAANLLPSLHQTGMEFSDFFQQIGEAVVDAQGKLDEKSESYRNDAKTKNYLPPTVFRIPRVSAEMKFSLEKVAGKKLGLVFYSEKTEAKQMHDQSVQFEIVAVPLPPEYVAKVAEERRQKESEEEVYGKSAPTRAMPRTALAAETRPEPLVESKLELSTRQKVFAQVEAFRANTVAETRKLKKDLLLDEKDRVLVFADEEHGTYFLVLATADKNKDLLLWQLVRDPSSLELLYRWPRTAKDRAPLEALHRYLVELGDRQQELLRPEG